ncbi:MAG: FHA domain-containing protein [Deltaproteobacteria bacterium]|nr:FHA domain-containing protein [Deltaproteobacteria bacterium]
MIRLIVREGFLEKKEFSLQDGTYILGRDPTCDLVLHANGVSRRHAKIEVKGQYVAVSDLGSSNGVFINGLQVQEKELHQGDIISFANVALEVSLQPVFVPSHDLSSPPIGPYTTPPAQKSFQSKFKKWFHENAEREFNQLLHNVHLSVIYGGLFLGFVVVNLFFTLGPSISESQQFIKNEAHKRGSFLVSRLVDLNEQAIIHNDISRIDVSNIDELEGVVSAVIVRPFVDYEGKLRAEIIAPIHRAAAMDMGEPWQKKSLGKIKEIVDTDGNKKKIVTQDQSFYVHEIDDQKILFSKPIFETVSGEQSVAALAQVTLGVPGLKINSTTYWTMFTKALLAALFLSFIFLLLLQKLTKHHLSLLYKNISSPQALEGGVIKSPVKFEPIQKIVNAMNEALDTIKNKASLTTESLTEDYNQEKIEALLKASHEGMAILDFSNRIVALNPQFENFFLIPEGSAHYQNIMDVMEDTSLVESILELVKNQIIKGERLTRRDGHVVDVQVQFVRNQRGSIEYSILSVREVLVA